MSASETPEICILTVLADVGGTFPDETARNVRELIGSGEPYIALEILCEQLMEHGIAVSSEYRVRLNMAANLMKAHLPKPLGHGSSG